MKGRTYIWIGAALLGVYLLFHFAGPGNSLLAQEERPADRNPGPVTRIGAKERRRQVQVGTLSLLESRLTKILNTDVADQAIATQLNLYRLPSHEADIVESEESWWWEPKQTNPNDFRMYISNPSNTPIDGLLVRLAEGECPALQSNLRAPWNYFFLQFSSPLGTNRASVIRADMPFSRQFQGCA